MFPNNFQKRGSPTLDIIIGCIYYSIVVIALVTISYGWIKILVAIGEQL